MDFSGTLMWYHKHKQTHTGNNRMTNTYKIILTPLSPQDESLLWIAKNTDRNDTN